MNLLVCACFFVFGRWGFFFFFKIVFCGFLFEFVLFGCWESGRKKERGLKFGNSHLSRGLILLTGRENLKGDEEAAVS